MAPQQQQETQGGGFTLPGAPQDNAGLPQNFTPFVFDGFDGLNTKPSRPAIEHQQCFILDNFMPLGKNNLRTLYDIGAPIYTASGLTVADFWFGNISDVSYCIVFLSDGSIVAVNLSSPATTTIAPAGTILSPTGNIGKAQWGSQYILISAAQTNGYFIWDGTLFYHAGTIGPVVDIQNGGNGYASSPTIVATGGHGTGATFTSTVTSSGSVSTITPVTAGSGYIATDAVVLSFSGGSVNAPTTAIATASIVGGRVASTAIVNAGSGYTSAAKAIIAGGGGANAALTVTASGGVSALLITNPGTGYTSNPTIEFSDVNSAVVQANIPIMPFGLQGTTVETFTSHVWLGNGAATAALPPKSLVTFSAPGSPTDFGTPDGGGSFLSTDSFLKVGFHRLVQSNGFLYLIGDSSVNYVSGVQTAGNPATTTFTNQNVDPQVGTPWPDTVQVFSRAIVFANTFGVHAMYGGAVQKVSAPLDGIYTSVTPTGNPPVFGTLQPSAAVAIIFGIHVYILLMPTVNQITGLQQNTLLMWDGARWWTATQSVNLIRIASLEINSILTAYGTDGTSIYPLFQTPSSAIAKTVASKLWDSPSYLSRKHAQRVLGLIQSNSNDAVSAQVAVDTEGGTGTGVATFNLSNVFAANWTATGGLPVTWTATGGTAVTWQTEGLLSFINQVEAEGVLLGLTFMTTNQDLTVISLTILGQQYNLTL